MFIGEDSLPKGKKLWFYPEDALIGLDLEDNEFNRCVISTIDRGTYFSNAYFIDRFGGKSSLELLSASSQILLEAANMKDCIINISELGNNGYDFLFGLKEGNVFLRHPRIYYSCSIQDIDILVNGEYRFMTLQGINEFMEDMIYGDR